jgi:hypothetical protein
MHFLHLATLVGAFLLAGCVSTKPFAEETVTVSVRPWFGICTGVCPNYDVTIWGDGRVFAVRYGFRALAGIERFRVSRAEAAEFRRIMRPYRPAGNQRGEPVCHHPVAPDDEPFVMKVREFEMVWSSQGVRRRLIACDDPERNEALSRALRAIQMYPDGRRITREDEPYNPKFGTP